MPDARHRISYRRTFYRPAFLLRKGLATAVALELALAEFAVSERLVRFIAVELTVAERFRAERLARLVVAEPALAERFVRFVAEPAFVAVVRSVLQSVI